MSLFGCFPTYPPLNSCLTNYPSFLYDQITLIYSFILLFTCFIMPHSFLMLFLFASFTVPHDVQIILFLYFIIFFLDEHPTPPKIIHLNKLHPKLCLLFHTIVLLLYKCKKYNVKQHTLMQNIGTQNLSLLSFTKDLIILTTFKPHNFHTTISNIYSLFNKHIPTLNIYPSNIVSLCGLSFHLSLSPFSYVHFFQTPLLYTLMHHPANPVKFSSESSNKVKSSAYNNQGILHSFLYFPSLIHFHSNP